MAEFTPDDLAAQVDQRAARVAGVDGRVGLHGVDVRRVVARVTGRHRPAQGADDAGGHGRAQPQGRAERDDRFADAERLRGTERGRLQRRRALGVQDGQVVDRAAPDDGGPVPVAVLVDDLDRAVVRDRVRDHVVVGDDVALPVQHEPGPGGGAALPVELRGDLHRAGQQRLGDRGDRAVVRLERRDRHGVDALQTAAHGAGPGAVGDLVVHQPADGTAHEPDDERERAHDRPQPAGHTAAGGDVAGRRHRERLGAGGREADPLAGRGLRRGGHPRRDGRRRIDRAGEAQRLRGLGVLEALRLAAAGGVVGETRLVAVVVLVHVPILSPTGESEPHRGRWPRDGPTLGRGDVAGDGVVDRGVSLGRTRFVTGARLSFEGASPGATPRARTPITAAPTAPPPRATSPVRRARPWVGWWHPSPRGAGWGPPRRNPFRWSGADASSKRQSGEARLDPALVLHQVAALVAGVDVLPGALGLLRGQLSVQQGADPRAEVSHHEALPRSGRAVPVEGPAGPE